MSVIPIRRCSVDGIQPSRTTDALVIKHAQATVQNTSQVSMCLRRPFIAHPMQGLGLLFRYVTTSRQLVASQPIHIVSGQAGHLMHKPYTHAMY